MLRLFLLAAFLVVLNRCLGLIDEWSIHMDFTRSFGFIGMMLLTLTAIAKVLTRS